MNKYRELIEKQRSEFSAFPMVFGFGKEQIARGMRELGLEPTDTNKLCGFAGTGGFYRRSDHAALCEMLDRHGCERQKAIQEDTTGDGYIFDMFDYELANHEYGYTGDPEDALDALALMSQLVDEGKKRRDPDKERQRESSQEKRIKFATDENISLTGGVGAGTVSEVLAQQTSLLLQEGTEIHDDFTVDLIAGECPAIEEFLERTDKDDR